jgi:hypothetical protein
MPELSPSPKAFRCQAGAARWPLDKREALAQKSFIRGQFADFPPGLSALSTVFRAASVLFRTLASEAAAT